MHIDDEATKNLARSFAQSAELAGDKLTISFETDEWVGAMIVAFLDYLIGEAAPKAMRIKGIRCGAPTLAKLGMKKLFHGGGFFESPRMNHPLPIPVTTDTNMLDEIEIVMVRAFT